MTSSTDNSSAPDLREQLKSVPEAPGCYLWKNAQGEILYVGKAVDLRARMMQYVSGQDERLKIPFMMEQVASFDYIVVNNETESLVLEKNLIPPSSSRARSTRAAHAILGPTPMHVRPARPSIPCDASCRFAPCPASSIAR